jgi:hypothetical protein
MIKIDAAKCINHNAIVPGQGCQMAKSGSLHTLGPRVALGGKYRRQDHGIQIVGKGAQMTKLRQTMQRRAYGQVVPGSQINTVGKVFLPVIWQVDTIRAKTAGQHNIARNKKQMAIFATGTMNLVCNAGALWMVIMAKNNHAAVWQPGKGRAWIGQALIICHDDNRR